MFNQKGNISKVKLQTSNSTGIPIWFMRQAGRYLPEYQVAMNPIKNFFDACYNPELLTELTLQPIRRFDFDAAIIFSDIMVLLDCMGFDVEFLRGHGPVISEERKHTRTADECFHRLSPVLDGIRMVRHALPPSKALIGFAGAPWTLLTYILGKDKNFARLRTAFHLQEKYVFNLLHELTELTSKYLIKQIECGADLIQLFDSNAYV
ncbi:uroporphyrinogen decarboxylase family protein, partial [Anaplasma bovis]|uniref:uroporphyrinogen decarboxylase family protein n=1 Tax=Anaplasma bovis TaxID=186733 RepID=UPI002FF359B5